MRETDNAPFIIAGAEGGIETVTFRPEGCDASTSTTIHGQRGSDGQGTQIANISNSAEQTYYDNIQLYFSPSFIPNRYRVSLLLKYLVLDCFN